MVCVNGMQLDSLQLCEVCQTLSLTEVESRICKSNFVIRPTGLSMLVGCALQRPEPKTFSSICVPSSLQPPKKTHMAAHAGAPDTSDPVIVSITLQPDRPSQTPESARRCMTAAGGLWQHDPSLALLPTAEQRGFPFGVGELCHRGLSGSGTPPVQGLSSRSSQRLYSPSICC